MEVMELKQRPLYQIFENKAGFTTNKDSLAAGQGLQCQKQGRIHGNPVADGWAGAVMQKPLANQKCDLPTDQPTDRPTRQVLESRVRD